ncbi:unnamed protein product [Penicillium salamii]|nr:unnamed protein product [Penicillium salamii]CAG8193750.1 unnamed protein product [Penicillium salamii]CAG8306676.1 unnamed protein product [Penicillium salamii]
MTVHYNPVTKEPYLQLPAPCANIIITPYREHQIKEDTNAMTSSLNGPRVYTWLQGPPYPFLPEHGEDWIKTKIQENKAAVAALQDEFENKPQTDASHQAQTENKFFGQCPFLCIREVGEDPSGAQDTLIGEIALIRYSFYEIRRNSWELALVQAHNKQLPVGHEDIVWTLGCTIRLSTMYYALTDTDYLSPTHHGKGIMSRAVQAVIRDWAVPRMNMNHLRGSFVVGNVGSQRVFERNNFEEVGVFKDWLPEIFKDWLPENSKKSLGKMSIVIMEWKGLLES